jgi:DNA-binding MarR family transcriptional regulator
MKKLVPADKREYARYLLGRVRFFMTRARRHELIQYNVSPRQAYILFLLHTLGQSTTLNELAWHTDRKINTLSINMTKMERDGLVKKVREPSSSMQIKFELTQKGIDTYLKCNTDKSVKAIMSVLSEEENQQLISILEKLSKKAERYEIGKI